MKITKFDKFIEKINYRDFDNIKLSDFIKNRVINEILKFKENNTSKLDLSNMTDMELAKHYYQCCFDSVRF